MSLPPEAIASNSDFLPVSGAAVAVAVIDALGVPVAVGVVLPSAFVDAGGGFGGAGGGIIPPGGGGIFVAAG